MMNQTQKHTTGKKLLALLLALIMAVSLLPMSVFATEADAETDQNVEQSTEPAAEDATVEPGQNEDEAAEEPAADPAETVADPQAMVKEAATVYADTTDATLQYRIVHLDCGRKYFSVDYIKGILETMAENGFNQLELAFGNGGLRFVLDTMDIVSETSTLHSSDDVKAAILEGNKSFYDDPNGNALTETQMKEIISYAQNLRIEIVPLLNMPGHMDGILSSTLFSQYKLSGSEGSLDLNNANAVAFGKALLKLYVDWFKVNGNSQYFNFGADEYGQGIRNPYIESTVATVTYAQLVAYMNACAGIIKEQGMTARCFNDFVCYNHRSSCDLDQDVQVCYWSNQWNGSEYNTPDVIASAGYQMINTSQKWYFVPSKAEEYGKNVVLSNFTTFDVTKYQNIEGGYNSSSTTYTQIPVGDINVGAMFCVWCDAPSVDVALTDVQDLIAAMAVANPDYFKADTPDTPAEVELSAEDADTGVTVAVKGQDGQTATVTVEEIAARTEGLPEGAQAVSYDVTPAVNGTAYTGEGTVTLPVPDAWKDSSDRICGYIVTDGNVETITGTYNEDSGKYTFDVLHFSEMGLLLLADGSVEVTNEETITVTVGKTATATISGANYAGTYTTEDPSIATVEVTGKDATAATTTYTQASVTCNDLISSDSKTYWEDNWQAVSGYYYTPDGTNYYPVYAKRSSSWSWAGRTYTYTWGYSTDSGSTVRQIGGTQSTTNTNTTPNITVYTQSGTEGTPASTTVTFTGVSVGTTYVTVGNTRYTINVMAEDLSNVVLPINLWITNTGVVPTGWTNGSPANFTYSDADGNRRSIYKLSAAAEGVNSEKGILLSSILPDMAGTAKSWDGKTYNVVYWKSAYHTAEYRQSTGGWTNESLNGTAFTYIRYWGGSWAYSVDGTDWVTIDNVGAEAEDTGKNQVNIWYRQKTTITDEVETQIVDWGPVTYSGGQCLLDFAVKYESGERTPNDFPVSGKTMGFDCPVGQEVPTNNGYVVQDSDGTYYRTVYGIAGVETEGYEVYMITVTPSNDNHKTYINQYSVPSSYTYAGTEKVAWAKTEADAANSGLPLMADIKYGGEPFLDKVSIYQYQGLLVTYYLRAKVTGDSLTVHYVDESVNTEFYRYVINVNSGTLFAENIGLADPWKGSLQNGTVTNDKGKEQTVSADLSTMPSIGAQYHYSDYTCIRVERSEDGKDVYLYYNFSNTKSFVIDFGLPLEIPLTALNDSLGTINITEVVVTGAKHGNAVYNSANKIVTYTLTSVLSEMETIGVEVTGGDAESTVSYNVNIIPASNVYYEDSFVTFANGTGTAASATWTTDGDTSATPATQALEELGKKTNLYGYDPAYNSCTTFSMGSARKVTVTTDMAKNWTENSAWPTATFTFKGTGFDIISLTDNTSGAITCEVKNSNGEAVYNTFINNYYGYKYVNGEVIEATSGDNKLYQLPVIKVSELTYDTYTVTLTAAYGAFFDKTGDDQYTFWLDAIRVYDPMDSNKEIYNTDNEKEGYPKYIELRNALAETSNGYRAVLIEGKESAEQVEYKNYGPNHEVYLAKNQTLAFKLDGELSDIATVQLGLKAVDGAATYKINEGEEKNVGTATDMYYEITDAAKSGETVLITNIGDTILSLTNIKVTFTASGKDVTLALMGEEAVNYAVKSVRALFAAAPVEPEPEPTFAPERFEAAWNRSTVRAGQKVTLTVKTSEDVESITVNGVTIDTYRTRTQRTGWGQNATKVTYREFTYTITAAETADYTITAVNAEGIASEPITATLTVQAASQRPGFGGWLDTIFSRWF